MKKRYLTGILYLLLGVLSGCAASDSGRDASREGQSAIISSEHVEGNAAASAGEDAQTDPADASASDRENEPLITEEILERCRAEFDRMAEVNEAVSVEEADALHQRFLDSGLMEREEMCLTDVAAGDYDGNGAMDMLVCLYSLEEDADLYSDGCLYLFMNEDEPYRIYEDFCCYGLGMIRSDFGADVDGDDRTEIVFLVQGTGNGGAGDSCKVIVKYLNPGIQRMEFPSDMEEDYDRGIAVSVKGDPDKGVYIASCAEFEEEIEFSAGREVDDMEGGNARGYYALEMGEYQGEKALLGYEYLFAGGIAEGVGDAVFVIKWDEAGNPYVADWYVEGYF